MEQAKQHSKKPGKTNTKTVELEQKLGETTAALQRLQADFENYRRRTQGEQALAHERVKINLIGELLPVLDNFDRAAQSIKQTDDPTIQGLLSIKGQLDQIISQWQIAKIDPRPGDAFDPTLHEALTHELSELPADTIVATVATGYQIGQNTIRPAQVRVSAGKAGQ